MLTVLLLDPRSFDTFTMPKSVAAHATSLFIAALLVWLVARHGRAILHWSPIHLGAGALLVAFALATPFALDTTVAVFGTFKRYLGLTQMLDNVLLFVAVGVLFREIRSLGLLAGVAVGVAVPVLGYAIVQQSGLDPLTFIQGPTRIPISTLGNPDIAGAFVSVIGVTALGYAALITGRSVRWYRLALALIGAGCIFVLFATGVRAGLLALGGGWLTVILLTRRMPHSGRILKIGTLAAAVLLALVVFVSPMRARLDPELLRTDLAVTSRLDIWQAALSAVAERPVLGLGPDNFVAAYPSRRNEASIKTGELQNSPHDVWLYAATSAGSLGLASLVLLVTLAFIRSWRLAGDDHPAAIAAVPLAAYLGQALVNVNDIAVDWIFWTSLGVIAGASGLALPLARRTRSSNSAWGVGVVTLAAAALVAAVTLVPRLVAGENMLASEGFSSAGRGTEAILYGAAVVGADPRRAEAWSSYGTALYAGGARAAAVDAFATAAARQPWHPLSWKNLAIGWNALGNADAAYTAAKRIPLTDPYDGEGREILAQLSYGRGDFASAAAEGESAIRYELNKSPSAYFTTISAYIQLQDLSHAESLARDAVASFNTIRFKLQLAAILADEDRKAEALAIIDQIIQENPDNQDAKTVRQAILAK